MNMRPTPLAEPLCWNEGMLLSPQHFQQNDIYWQQQLAFRTQCSRPYAWGLWDLSIDEHALRQGVVRVEHVHALMPDGLAVQFPADANDTSLSELKLADLDDIDQQALDATGLSLYLAVPKRMPGAASGNSDMRRYIQVPGGTALDENTGRTEVSLDRLRACLSLIPKSKRAGGHEYFPLLHIERRGTEFALGSFHPPLLRSSAANFLGDDSILKRLNNQLLTIMERAQGQASDASGQRITSALTSVLPPLHIMASSGQVHPFDLYLQMAQLLGQIAQLSNTPVRKLVTKPYKHDDLEPGFALMFQAIRDIVSEVRVGLRSRDFVRINDGAFEIQLDPQWDLDSLMVEMRGQNRLGMEKWIRDAHIGDAKIHLDLQRRRLPGAVREPADESLAKLTPMEDDGVLYCLGNSRLPLSNGKPAAVLRTGGTLRVQGPADGIQPHTLVLYYPTANQAHKAAAASNKASGMQEPSNIGMLGDLDDMELTPPTDGFSDSLDGDTPEVGDLDLGALETGRWDKGWNGGRDG